MKPIERVGTTLQHKEPDKVPIFLFLLTHGATELGIDKKKYFSSPELLAKGQVKLQEKYQHDCLYAFHYAAKEYEAFGGNPLVKENGSPESGYPVFKDVSSLLATELPNPFENQHLLEIVETQDLLYEEKGSDLPIINSIIAPLSLPVMLLGFERWIETIVDEPEQAQAATKYLSEYVIGFVEMLFEHHASALAYFNPLASTEMIGLHEYEQISLGVDRKIYSNSKGPLVYAMAGSRSGNLLNNLVNRVGIRSLVVSNQESLSGIKSDYGKDLILIGNLDNISMSRWNQERAEAEIRRCIEEGAEGGGYIISEHHGEIPFNTPDSVLENLVSARDKWGVY